MDQISEAERITRLMLFIRENGPVDFASIRDALPYEYGESAGNMDATRRRFERDKRTLQEYGVFFDLDDRQRYSLDSSLTVAAPVSLTKPQVSLLRLLCGALLADKDYPLKEELRMVLVKLGDELEIPDMLPQLEDGGLSGANKDKEPQGFAKVKRSIAQRKLLTFSYAGSHGSSSMREVEPFGCFFLKGICYVVAFDPGKDGERVFRLDRMSKIKIKNAGSKNPDFEERPFVASRYYGLPFQYGSDDSTARMLIDESVARDVTSLTMNQGSLEAADDGVIWTVDCRDERALARWCIENGPGIRILEPLGAQQLYMDGVTAYLAAASEGGSHEG